MGMSLPTPPLCPFVLAKVSLEGGKVQVLWLSGRKEQGREGLQGVSISESWIRGTARVGLGKEDGLFWYKEQSTRTTWKWFWKSCVEHGRGSRKGRLSQKRLKGVRR